MAKKVLDEEPKKSASKKVNEVAPTKEEAEIALEEVAKEGKVSKETELSKKNSKNAVKALICCVVIAVLAVVCFFGYKMFMGGNPVKITSNAIRGLKDIAADTKKDSNGMIDLMTGNDPFEINSTIKLDLPAGFGNYSAKINLQADPKNEDINLTLNAKEGKTDILSLNSIITDNKLYFQLPDTMKNYYYLNAEEMINEFKKSFTDIESQIDVDLMNDLMNYDANKIVDYLADAIDDSLSKSDFKKSKEEITVIDKDTKATKYTAKISQKKLFKIAQKFIENASNDKDLMKILAKATGASEKEVKDMLKEVLKTNAEEGSDETIFLYSVYVSIFGNTLGYGFEVEDLGSILITTKGDKTKVEVTYGMYYGYLTIDKKSDEHYVISASFMGMINGEVDVKSKLDTIKKNKEYKESVEVGINISAMGANVNASIKTDSHVKKIDKVDTADIKGAINAEKMSSSEQSKFMSEVEKSAFYKFMKSFSKKVEQSGVVNYSL